MPVTKKVNKNLTGRKDNRPKTEFAPKKRKIGNAARKLSSQKGCRW